MLPNYRKIFGSLVLSATLLCGLGPQALANGISRFFGSSVVHHSVSVQNSARRGNYAASVQQYNWGVEAFSQRRYSDAAVAFSNALEMDSSLRAAHGPLGQALFLQGAYESAFPHLQTAVGLEPGNSTYWCQLAVAATRLGSRDTALSAFAQYLQIEPQGSYAQEARRSIKILQNTAAAVPSSSAMTEENYLREFGNAPRRWKANGAPLRVYLADAGAVPNFDYGYHQVVRDALDEWTRLSGGRIRFEVVERADQAQIICDWTADRFRLQSTDDLGQTTLHFNGKGDIQSARITFLTTFAEVHTRQEMLRRAESVALHELGHALGLQHSHEPGDIMFATVAPLGLEFSPSVRDRNTLITLYKP